MLPPRIFSAAVFVPLSSLACLSSCAFAPATPDGGIRDSSDAHAREDASISTDAATQSAADAAPVPIDAAASAIDAAQPSPADAAPPITGLVISEVVDATLSGGLPKFVELTNTSESAIDLSGFSFGVYSNGGTSLLSSASVVLSGVVLSGDSYIISFENADSPGNSSFFDVYGFDADNMSFGGSINGNDALVLFLADGNGLGGAATGDGSDATVVDVYGEVGVDGEGAAWEYSNGFATRRAASVHATPVFQETDWGFSGPDALIGLDAAGIAAATSPGTHSFL